MTLTTSYTVQDSMDYYYQYESIVMATNQSESNTLSSTSQYESIVMATNQSESNTLSSINQSESNATENIKPSKEYQLFLTQELIMSSESHSNLPETNIDLNSPLSSIIVPSIYSLDEVINYHDIEFEDSNFNLLPLGICSQPLDSPLSLISNQEHHLSILTLNPPSLNSTRTTTCNSTSDSQSNSTGSLKTKCRNIEILIQLNAVRDARISNKETLNNLHLLALETQSKMCTTTIPTYTIQKPFHQIYEENQIIQHESHEGMKDEEYDDCMIDDYYGQVKEKHSMTNAPFLSRKEINLGVAHEILFCEKSELGSMRRKSINVKKKNILKRWMNRLKRKTKLIV